MAGIELKNRAMVVRVCEEVIRRGVWLRPLGEVLVLMPPLAISKKELRFLIDVVRNSVILGTE
jgi:adenosylmethionine---8-amino-7-oxononanoate aminotransferase